MNITFFIGNGFDLNIGLKTKYSHFYPYFFNNASKDNAIREWIENDEMQWADLEKKLGQSLDKIWNKKEKFYSDKAELDRLLLEYLGKEQERFTMKDNENAIANEFKSSLLRFYDGLPEMAKDSINDTCSVYKDQDFEYCFICFNYTDVLDQIVNITFKAGEHIATHEGKFHTKKNKLGKLLHIHGTLNEEVILGVNDLSQINNIFLQDDQEFLDIIIKERINRIIGQKKTEYAKNIIDNSHIICIFGMSIGVTDKMWWEEIVDWLKRSTNNKLIIYYKGYEEELHRKIPITTIRLTNLIKNEMLEKGGIDIQNSDIQDYKNRIFISFNANIFNFNDMNLIIDT